MARRRSPFTPLGGPRGVHHLPTQDAPITDVGAAMVDHASYSDTLTEQMRGQLRGPIDAARAVDADAMASIRDAAGEAIAAAGALDDRLHDEIATYMRGALIAPAQLARDMGDEIAYPWETPAEPAEGADDGQSYPTIDLTPPGESTGGGTIPPGGISPLVPSVGQVIPGLALPAIGGAWPPAGLIGRLRPRPGSPASRTAPAGPGQPQTGQTSPLAPAAPTAPVMQYPVQPSTNGQVHPTDGTLAGCCGIRFVLLSDNSWRAEIPLESAPELAALLPRLDALVSMTYQTAETEALGGDDSAPQQGKKPDAWS